jgi:flagellar biosynthesis protein FlhB
MAGDKTEKATPKKKEETRKKGQVAKSADLNGAVILIAALFSLSATGPFAWRTTMTATHDILIQISTPGVVSIDGSGVLMTAAGKAVLVAVGPIALVCFVAGVLVNVAQVGWKPSVQALKPDPKKLNPISGAKNLFGTRALFETAKNVAKVAVVGVIAFTAVKPKIDEVGGLVGLSPGDIVSTLGGLTLSIAQRTALAYLLIAVIDIAYQRYSFDKKQKMDKQEIKDESKSQGVPAEVKNAQRRRQMQAARGRMMAEVPTADVVVMNPTHFAVALRFTSEHPAPVCVAKGQDLMALRIRAIAEEAGVTVVVEPPLARSLHASVEVGRMIPEDFFQAVAQLLAYVYRIAGTKARTA